MSQMWWEKINNIEILVENYMNKFSLKDVTVWRDSDNC